MENNSSKKNHFGKDYEGDMGPYDESTKSKSPETNNVETGKEALVVKVGKETTEKSDDIDENIAVKVEGDYNSDTRLDKNLGTSEDIDPIEDVVRDWEASHLRIKLTRRARKLALLAASLHLYESRGITVNDLKKLGMSKDNAEMKLYLSKKNDLLIPHETLKIGKQKQYFLSNYKYIIDFKDKQKAEKKDKEIIPDDDLILQLLRIISCRKYKSHNIHLETNLNYKADYESIPWNIPSSNNKQKVKTFKLEPRRKCSITVSRTGTVEISIECTLESYKFHTPSDLVTFIGACGEALREIKIATNDRTNVVPAIPEWYFTQLEFNKDISTKDPAIVRWAPVNGRLKIKYLGVIFQIYPKGLPELGDCARFESRFTSKKKEKRMTDTLADIVNDGEDIEDQGKKSPFVTAEEMLRKVKEKLESEEKEDESSST